MQRYFLFFTITLSLSLSLCAQNPAITIARPVKDQQNPITGKAPASTAGTLSYVQLFVRASEGATPEPIGDPEIVTTDGRYTLHVTVTGGTKICVGTGASFVANNCSDFVLVQPSDNEREHIDFFAGTVISQGESNFAQADTFLALNVDRALVLPGFYRGNKTPGINTFFQARLTTIPVNASTTTMSSATPAAPATPSLSSVLSSQKTGHFEAGFYMPWTFGSVPKIAADKPKQTFYIAPIGRFGYNTLASGSNQTTITSGAASSAPTTTVTTTALGTVNPLPNSYNFFVAGVRIGTASLDPGSLHNIHYLDITIGKFSNLENLLCKAGPAAKCSATSTTAAVPEYRYRPLRLSFEGYYEIPTSGFIVGMSANVGPGFFDHGGNNTDPNNRAPADLRFLFGYKFDVNKLFKALPMLSQ